MILPFSVPVFPFLVLRVARILGFQMNLDNGEITTYSDGTLERFMTMKENPFRFKRVN